MGKGIIYLVLSMLMFVGYLSPEEVKAERNNFDYKEELIQIDKIAEEKTHEEYELDKLREELSRQEATGFRGYKEYVYTLNELIDTHREYVKQVETEEGLNRLEVIEQEITRRVKRYDKTFGGYDEWVASQWSADLFKKVLDKLEPENSEFEKELNDYATERYEKHVEGVAENKLEIETKEGQEKGKGLMVTDEISDELREELKEELKEEIKEELKEELKEVQEDETSTKKLEVVSVLIIGVILLGITGFVLLR